MGSLCQGDSTELSLFLRNVVPSTELKGTNCWLRMHDLTLRVLSLWREILPMTNLSYSHVCSWYRQKSWFVCKVRSEWTVCTGAQKRSRQHLLSFAHQWPTTHWCHNLFMHFDYTIGSYNLIQFFYYTNCLHRSIEPFHYTISSESWVNILITPLDRKICLNSLISRFDEMVYISCWLLRFDCTILLDDFIRIFK